MTAQITVAGVPALAMTPELEEVIRYAGGDPRDYNVMRWPVGAGRYGSIRVLVDESRIQEVYGTQEYITVELGDVEFDLMKPLPARPIMPTSGGVLYDVTIVDERYDWQGIAYDEVGFNVSTDDKSAVFASSGKDDGLGNTIPVTVRDATERLLCALEAAGAVFPSAVAFLEPENDPLAYDGMRDVTAGGLPIGPVIDQVLAHVGHVLVAYPSVGYHDPTDGATATSSTGCFEPGAGSVYRYAVLPIADGAESAVDQITAEEDRIVSGGLTHTPEVTLAGFPAKVVSLSEQLEQDVPSSIRVQFPLATSDADYTRNDADGNESGVSWQSDRYEVISGVTAGRPVVGTGAEITVTDSLWAISNAGEIENAAELADRADDVARYYYHRWSAGTGDLVFAGLRPIVPWAGAQTIEWRLDRRGETTRVSGDIHDPIFGWSQRESLTPSSVMSTGWVRAIPRPGGGILLDVPPEATLRRLYYAKITAVSAAFNATYDAVAIGFPGVSVEQKTPLRPWDTSLVDVEAVGVDEPCIIGEREDGTLDLYVLQEKPTLTTCEGQVQAASQDDAVAFGVHGV